MMTKRTPAELGKARNTLTRKGKAAFTKQLDKLTPKQLQAYAKSAKITVRQARRDRARKPVSPALKEAAVKKWKTMCSGEFSREITYASLRDFLKEKFGKVVAIQTLSDWCKHIVKPVSARRKASNDPRHHHEYSLSQSR